MDRLPIWKATLREELARFAALARAPRIRSLRQWAEAEIWIPEGQHEGERFRCRTLPWTGLLFDAIDSDRYRRIITVGCVQGGKTFNGFVAPICWHLFEHKERVIAGTPTFQMLGAKWHCEIEPVIDAHPQWRHLKPKLGRGSKGGLTNELRFRHGVHLQWMTGHGGDEQRSGATTRIVVITEADRMDAAGEASDEAAPIYQLEARTHSYGERARIYAECTVTTDDGYVWQSYLHGTRSRIMCPCVHCGEYVAPEREDLVGWHECETRQEAEQRAAFKCPACAALFTDDERRVMNERAVLVHRGQSIDSEGNIEGEPPATDTLGFRFTAWNNLLWSTAFIAGEEWDAAHSRDPHNAERKMRQWFWVIPIEPDAIDVTPLTPEDVAGNTVETLTRGVLPDDTTILVAAADLRKRQLHYVIRCWRADGTSHFVDVGILPVESATYGTLKGLRLAQRELRDKVIEPGYRTADGRQMVPQFLPIDGGWEPGGVRPFIRECQVMGVKRYMISFGRGHGTRGGKYRHPEALSKTVHHIGEEYHIRWSVKHALHAIFADANYWKGQLREALATPDGEPGGCTVFEPTTEEDHRLLATFARQICAEKAQETIVPGKGVVIVYVNEHRSANHFGDAAYWTGIVGHLAGARVLPVDAPPAAQIERSQSVTLTTPDGRPYLVTDREE